MARREFWRLSEGDPSLHNLMSEVHIPRRRYEFCLKAQPTQAGSRLQ
jgi:hypothetical protein